MKGRGRIGSKKTPQTKDMNKEEDLQGCISVNHPRSESESEPSKVNCKLFNMHETGSSHQNHVYNDFDSFTQESFTYPLPSLFHQDVTVPDMEYNEYNDMYDYSNSEYTKSGESTEYKYNEELPSLNAVGRDMNEADEVSFSLLYTGVL